ncbi:MAG: argininosuccinate lyase, partial [Candidatus Altarchaeaceae archaeon]
KMKNYEFTKSLDIDRRLYKADIWNTIVHNLMLAKQGIIKKETARKIIENLRIAENLISSGNFKFDEKLEDIHMNIEKFVIERGGEECGMLHTARSRNDQVVTDTRIVTRELTIELMENLLNFCSKLIKFAERSKGIIIPGYTHLQQAMPTLASHWILAYVDAFLRDLERINDTYKRINLCPLGGVAFAGTSFNIDRNYTAKLLGFDGLIENSQDAVASRDFIVEILSDIAIVASNLSRLCEEIIIFNSYEFNLIEISTEYTTGSSIMPQKKNPDIAELIRGKTGRIYGNLMNILTLLKSLPYSYNRDLQEDKFPLFDSFDEINKSLKIFGEMIENMKFKEIKEEKFDKGIIATDIANELVIKGIPFRKAYNIVKNALKNNDFSEIEEAKNFNFETIKKIIESRKSIGSSSYKECERMIEERKKKIKIFEDIINEKKRKIEESKKLTEEEILKILKNDD